MQHLAPPSIKSTHSLNYKQEATKHITPQELLSPLPGGGGAILFLHSDSPYSSRIGSQAGLAMIKIAALSQLACIGYLNVEITEISSSHEALTGKVVRLQLRHLRNKVSDANEASMTEDGSGMRGKTDSRVEP